jgi:RimJ/RimL family protein N-acetyltransferase
VWLTRQLLTERLILRRGRPDDRIALVRLLTDENVRRHLGGPVPEADAWERLSAEPGQAWGSFVMELQATNAVVGSCSITPVGSRLELAIAMLPEFWRRGLAAEGLAAVLSWAAREQVAPTVFASTQQANVASLALLERLGFECTDRFVKHGMVQVTMSAELALFE